MISELFSEAVLKKMTERFLEIHGHVPPGEHQLHTLTTFLSERAKLKKLTNSDTKTGKDRFLKTETGRELIKTTLLYELSKKLGYRPYYKETPDHHIFISIATASGPMNYDPLQGFTNVPYEGKRITKKQKEVMSWLMFGSYIDQLIKKEPNNPELPQHSKRAYLNALKIDPEDPISLLEIGNHAYRQEDYTAATKLYKKVVKLDPKQSKAWNNLGIIQRIQGNNKAAEKTFEKAAKANPRNTTVLYNKAAQHIVNNQPKKVVETYAQLLRYEPDNLKVRLTKAKYHEKLRQIEEAHHEYRKVLYAEPHNQRALEGIKNAERYLR